MESHCSLPCCDLLNDQTLTFKYDSVVGDKDYFSSIAYDCLNIIFGFLNHDDLELISQVSQKMRTLGIQARRTTRKKTARELKVYRNYGGDVCVKLSGTGIPKRPSDLGRTDGLKFFMRLKNNQNEHNKIITCISYVPTNLYTDQDYNATTPHIPIVKEITCGVYKRIRYLTDRFSISTLHLSSITIDRHLILHFSNVFKFNTFCKIIADVDFEEETDSIIFQKFTNFITLKKPGQLELCTEFFRQRECESQFIDALIRNGNSTELKLFLRSVYDGDRVRSIPLPYYLYDRISKFDNFDFPCFVVDSNRLIKIVLDRLDREKTGMLLVRVNKIDQNFLVTAMKHRKLKHQAHNIHEVYSVQSNRRAEILWNANRFESYNFYVFFFSR
ncbi:hypothetical protein PRIPAC_75273 [Pristionchus pacificus]|uniref:Uncharacterized protein n=1 Tax=Pristionchus pacificus TaxID=54126 RepID=A0A2A6C8U9_PRIPA|nr:hypothetical protein PRIPAC_75273 [Pristionchus pacificus]|eukprot:PDM74604.1 hypothetical protein PRIPAC_41960 [Pristionchus pacificus]